MATQSVMVALSPGEARELEDHEATVAKGLDTFLAVGKALAAIKSRKLYRATHASFEGYLKERWGLSRPRGYQLISAAETLDTLGEMSTVVDISEGQVRPLARLKTPALRREAWRKAQETAPRGGVTGKHVRAVVDQMTGAGKSSAPVLDDTEEETWDLLGPFVVPDQEAPAWRITSHGGAIDIGMRLSEEAPLDLVIKAGRNFLNEAIAGGHELDNEVTVITSYSSFVVWRRNDLAAVATSNPDDPTTILIRTFT